MTPLEANDILIKFHNSIKDLRPESIVQPTSSLPCTVGIIRYAHFVFGDFCIKSEVDSELFTSFVTKEGYRLYMESYGILDSFFMENPEPINQRYNEYLEGLRKGTITDFIMPNPFGETARVLEYFNFLGESLFKEGKGKLPNDNDIIETFVYDELRKKAKEDSDVELLISLVNSSLTRAVLFPGKKRNEESVFI